jgi:archaetidylinositol phosphate synthase
LPAGAAMSSDERVGLRGELAVAIGDPAGGVGRPPDGHALVADRDVGVVVGGLGGLGQPVDERDRGREVVEGELALERSVDLRPLAHAREYGEFRRSRKQTPTTELVVAWFYRPLAHLVVLALLPLRISPPAVVLAGAAAGIGAAVELARGDYGLAAALLVLKTVLDGADGALARASGRVTALGRYLDSECDLLVNAALFAALGYATQRPFAALGAFLVLTLVLSVNYNLRRLYLLDRGVAEEALPGPSLAARLARRVYELVYAPQDRLVEWFVRRRRSADDLASLTILHNLGLATQHTVLAACLLAGRPELWLWTVFACGLTLVPLQRRRELLAAQP